MNDKNHIFERIAKRNRFARPSKKYEQIGNELFILQIDMSKSEPNCSSFKKILPNRNRITHPSKKYDQIGTELLILQKYMSDSDNYQSFTKHCFLIFFFSKNNFYNK